MKITFLTLLPNLYSGLTDDGIIARALNEEKVEIDIVDIRNYATRPNRQVDDYAYGGGPGILIMVEPIVKAIRAHKKKNSKVFLMSPQGKTFTQKYATELAKEEHIILIAGRYEGVDERIQNYIDGEISIGDYILTGGELPSMVIADSLIRLQSEVLGNSESLKGETFSDNLLKYPNYTRPAEFEGHQVPKVLLSGNHQEIKEWREKQSEKLTKEKRPDLIKLKKIDN